MKRRQIQFEPYSEIEKQAMRAVWTAFKVMIAIIIGCSLMCYLAVKEYQGKVVQYHMEKFDKKMEGMVNNGR